MGSVFDTTCTALGIVSGDTPISPEKIIIVKYMIRDKDMAVPLFGTTNAIIDPMRKSKKVRSVSAAILVISDDMFGAGRGRTETPNIT